MREAAKTGSRALRTARYGSVARHAPRVLCPVAAASTPSPSVVLGPRAGMHAPTNAASLGLSGACRSSPFSVSNRQHDAARLTTRGRSFTPPTSDAALTTSLRPLIALVHAPLLASSPEGDTRVCRTGAKRVTYLPPFAGPVAVPSASPTPPNVGSVSCPVSARCTEARTRFTTRTQH